jgi:23S rRNA (cytosine1962-C5)-methyltransferase
VVVVRQAREAVLLRSRHPWIYSQSIVGVEGEPADGELLPVASAEGRIIGWGFHSPDSLIAVRMVSYGEKPPGEGWLSERIRASCALRAGLGIDSDAVRLVNAEGDFLPGLVVDSYGDTIVVSPHTRGMETRIEQIVSALLESFPEARVFLKRDEQYAGVESLGLAAGYLVGDGDGTSLIQEAGVRFIADFAKGQKTGFYLDQRENRRLAALLGRGRTMLNLFSYTGAFALRAAAAGAGSVVSVESSARAIEASRRNAELNPGIGPQLLRWVHADVFAFLKDPGRHDVIVADPPPFARRRAETAGAVRGYVSLFLQVLKALNPAGFAFLFSCSGAVDRPLFRKIVSEAAFRSGRSVRLLRELHADADHPVAAAHPEGEYLKGWLVNAQ